MCEARAPWYPSVHGHPGSGGDEALYGEDADRGRLRPADAAAQAAAGGPRARPLGRHAGRRLHERRDPVPERDGDHRRARAAHVRRGAAPHQRPRPRAGRARHRGGRQRRDPLSQPPRLHRHHGRAVQARRQRAVPQHRVRRPADRRGLRPRGREGHRLRRGVHRSRQGGREGPQALRRLDRGGDRHEDDVLEELIANGDPSDLSPPDEKGRVVILTSGTTGSPKGASRKQPESLDPAAILFSKIPLRTRETTHIAAPLFHSWGFLHFTLGLGLSSTLILRRKFDPEGALSAVAQFECTTLAVVPVMIQRILDLPEDTITKYDTRSLKIIAASGSALPGDLATKTMDLFGDVLYNLYGSTEVAWATIAQPKDIRQAPGTAGKVPRGTVVKLYDDDGNEVTETGETGRIFVGNEMQFEGYTSGGSKDEIDVLMSSGDVGHFDENGNLFIDGRDDEMIVSGGENVFPAEVEDLLAKHSDINEAAIIGVEDEKFGQALKAFVVPCGGKKPSEDELKKYVKENLANYKVPKAWVFLDELPRNATGKVLKKDLKEEDEESSDNGSKSEKKPARKAKSKK